MARYLARRILGLVDKDNDVSVSFLQETIVTFVGYEVTLMERLGGQSKLLWQFAGVVGRKPITGFHAFCVQCNTSTLA